jgi:beta-lactam-binding protein with PASTA domain
MAPWAGETLQDARAYLDSLDIELYILIREEYSSQYPAGTITRTNPAEGGDLRKGQTVIIWVSLGPQIVKAPMPNLLSGTGMLMDTAAKILNNNGFKNLQWVPVDNLAPYGTVLSQSVTANTEIDVNTLIVLEYSTGKAPEPTNPSEPGIPEQKEIEYSFVLPSVAESYTLRIEMDGQVILAETTIQPGQTEWTMVLTGSGIQVYTLYVNSEIYETVTVDFESYE